MLKAAFKLSAGAATFFASTYAGVQVQKSSDEYGEIGMLALTILGISGVLFCVHTAASLDLSSSVEKVPKPGTSPPIRPSKEPEAAPAA